MLTLVLLRTTSLPFPTITLLLRGNSVRLCSLRHVLCSTATPTTFPSWCEWLTCRGLQESCPTCIPRHPSSCHARHIHCRCNLRMQSATGTQTLNQWAKTCTCTSSASLRLKADWRSARFTRQPRNATSKARHGTKDCWIATHRLSATCGAVLTLAMSSVAASLLFWLLASTPPMEPYSECRCCVQRIPGTDRICRYRPQRCWRSYTVSLRHIF